MNNKLRKIGYINITWNECEGCPNWRDGYGCMIDAEVLDKYLRLENSEVVCEYEEKNK